MSEQDFMDRFKDLIPPEIEQEAIRLFQDHSQDVTGHKWDWAKASMDIRNRWRIKSLLADLDRLKQKYEGDKR